jgi:hypothetical protein
MNRTLSPGKRVTMGEYVERFVGEIEPKTGLIVDAVKRTFVRDRYPTIAVRSVSGITIESVCDEGGNPL